MSAKSNSALEGSIGAGQSSAAENSMPTQQDARAKVKAQLTEFREAKGSNTVENGTKQHAKAVSTFAPSTVSQTTRKFVPQAKATGRRLNGNNVRMADLPEFAIAKWKRTFLPTLYSMLYTSDNAFDGFHKASHAFVSLLQNILIHVYPDVDYKVTATESIHFLAYNRINEKRSSIGSDAINIIKGHLVEIREKPSGGPGDKEWLRWCMRVDGPLFFKDPSPFTSPTDKHDPNYVIPGGRLLSPFIIQLATPLLSFSVGSVINGGHPKGLIALIMAALERAVKHISMPSVGLDDFSKEHWGEKVRVYYHSLSNIPESRWQELRYLCSSKRVQEEEEAHAADLSIMDAARPFVFDFSSPKK
ncbi:hypothetical protein D9613_011304 [Agrocybe pediades]|uniref:Uncharacterized protein n=1 Tax=Agrocybe pediades TaxID=84607 RepID=A0A8H4VNH2_9AGAR|nr:hypothetical protein D9613_011304 [Agrocybe pediades]